MKNTGARRGSKAVGPQAVARLEDRLDRIASRLEALRARHAVQLQALGRERDELRRQQDERAVPFAARAWEWVERVHADGSAERVRRVLQRLATFAESVVILGPVREDGGGGHGRTGDSWVSLRLDVPGVDVSERTGPAWGHLVAVRGAEHFGKVAPGVVASLAEAIESGAVWGRITGDLSKKLADFGRQQGAAVVAGRRALQAEVRALRARSS